MAMRRPIYLDYNATTPVARPVVDAMEPYFNGCFGNPSSGHPYGETAAEAIRESRQRVAALLGAADPDEITFCGCATEANNLALLGVARAIKGTKRRHIVISAVEHPSVVQPALRLKKEGWAVTVVPVDGYGRVDPEAVRKALRPDTVLVSVMHANNETGTIQPIADIAQIAHEAGALMHTDAAQSVGKISVKVDRFGVDLLTLAGHKFYAPKGVGALYLKKGTPCSALLAGADQEHGLRPGTENVPYIVGLGEAAWIARLHLPRTTRLLGRISGVLHEAISLRVPGLTLNGHPSERLPNTLNVSFPGVQGWQLLNEVRNSVAASTGSACHADNAQPSGVLGAMGLDAKRAAGAIRLSVGTDTREEDVEWAAAELALAWERLQDDKALHRSRLIRGKT